MGSINLTSITDSPTWTLLGARFKWVVLIAFLTAPILLAQQSTETGYSVHGTVVNAMTNRAIARAQVILGDEYACLTDNEGKFDFGDVPSGDYVITIRRPGYTGDETQGSGNGAIPATRHHVHVEGTTPSLRFALRPSAIIDGRVELQSTGPAGGIRVTAYRKQADEGYSRWVVAGIATTDSEGAYHLGNLASGFYVLFTQFPFQQIHHSAKRNEAWGYPALYYPGVTDPSEAGILKLNPGENVEANFVLASQRFYAVTAEVRVSSADESPSFQLLDAWERPTDVALTYDSQKQLIHADVPNGRWILESQSFGGVRSYGRTEFQVVDAPLRTKINIHPIAHIPVTIRRQFNSPNAAAIMQPDGPSVAINLISTHLFGSNGVQERDFRPVAACQSDCEWIGTIVAPAGEYWVDATSWAGHVASMTSGGVDLTQEPLLIPEETVPPSIEIVLRDDSGAIAGQIKSRPSSLIDRQERETAEPESYIYAIPLFPTSSQIPKSLVDACGHFKISNLAPGRYRVVASGSQLEIAIHSTDELSSWEGEGQVVSVGVGNITRIEVGDPYVE